MILILALAGLSGCAGDQPASVGATTPAQPSASAAASPEPIVPGPSPSVLPVEASVAPAATPSAPPGETAARRWPVDVAGLFSPGGVPDDFAVPLHVCADGTMFLYLTDGGAVRKAVWNGAGYVTTPVVENLDAEYVSAVVVDEAGGRLFCPGLRQYSSGGTGPSIVMVSLADGARCNIDEAAGFHEEGLTVSGDFQYGGGMVLARLAGARGAPVDKWALFDIAAKTYTVLDFTNFIGTALPGWRERVSLCIALAGGRLLAVCTVAGYAEPSATGSAAAEKSPYECLAVLLDMKGSPAGVPVRVAGGQTPVCCALQDAAGMRVSQDGTRLLYEAQGMGLYVYDIAANRETPVYEGGALPVFAGWGRDGAVYYAAAASQPAGGYLIYRADAPDTLP